MYVLMGLIVYFVGIITQLQSMLASFPKVSLHNIYFDLHTLDITG